MLLTSLVDRWRHLDFFLCTYLIETSTKVSKTKLYNFQSSNYGMDLSTFQVFIIDVQWKP